MTQNMERDTVNTTKGNPKIVWLYRSRTTNITTGLRDLEIFWKKIKENLKNIPVVDWDGLSKKSNIKSNIKMSKECPKIDSYANGWLHKSTYPPIHPSKHGWVSTDHKSSELISSRFTQLLVIQQYPPINLSIHPATHTSIYMWGGINKS